MFSTESKVKVQGAGRFLSMMVLPNIGAFIAWGLISALFIPQGWFPNAQLALMVEPIITYFIPLLIGYTGGKLVAGERGAVVGAVTTMGLIAGSEVPMLMEAMIGGPLGGLAIKHVDNAIQNRVRSGFEMLVNNFSAGIIGMLGAVLAFLFIGPFMSVVSAMLTAGIEVLVESHTLALVAFILEPAKILFLNNGINHGILTPLGIQQIQEAGNSIFFLLETNPGPGLGLLMAYAIANKGRARQTAAGATVIHLFGGIQEVYFPYVMMKPRLLLAVILGGIAGIYTLEVFDAGLISPASPGSLISILLMTPRSSFIGVICSISISTLVSFVVAYVLLKTEKKHIEDTSAATHHATTVDVPVVNNGVSVKISPQHICLDIKASTKEDVIAILGNKLVQLGHVEPEYVDGMLKREALLSTYLGQSIALPHGMVGGKKHVINDGFVIGQIPEGVQWGDNPDEKAQIIVAIAAKADSHIHLISAISSALDDDKALEILKTTNDPNVVLQMINDKKTA